VALSFGAAKEEDVLALISKKNYAKAIEVLKKGKADPRAKMQLADVLVMAGKPREAVAVLSPLADEYAREGFAAKAVAVLKKIQKIDPTRHDVEQKLASLIQEKQRAATISLPTVSPSLGGLPEMGIEEIGMEPPNLEMGMEAGPELSFATPPAIPQPEPAPVPPAPVAPVAPAPTPLPVAALPPLVLESEPLVLDAVAAPEVPPAGVAPLPTAPSAAKPTPALVDTDFFTEEDLRLDEPEAETVAAPFAPALNGHRRQ
jgi:hypothetical protein